MILNPKKKKNIMFNSIHFNFNLVAFNSSCIMQIHSIITIIMVLHVHCTPPWLGHFRNMGPRKCLAGRSLAILSLLPTPTY